MNEKELIKMNKWVKDKFKLTKEQWIKQVRYNFVRSNFDGIIEDYDDITKMDLYDLFCINEMILTH